MRKIVLAALFMAVVPIRSNAAPCVLSSLATYTGLAAGCNIGSTLFTNFSSIAAPGATQIAPANILVNPLSAASSVGFGFQLNVLAGAGQIFGNSIGYHVSGPAVSGSSLSLQGSTVAEDGAVTAVQLLPKTLIVFDIGIDADLVAQTSFAPISSFDASTELTIDGGTDGRAVLNGVVANRFLVPELASTWLLGPGLGALAWLCRRARRLPGVSRESTNQRSTHCPKSWR